jgi:tetratricopeptide (TPR) repeat protein
MGKVIKFPGPQPEKFGLQRVHKRKGGSSPKTPQLNLFTGGKIVKLSQQSTFDEALYFDEQGDVSEARKRYAKAITEGGDTLADAYCNLGIIESQDGNHAKAIDCFTMALKVEPRHFEAHYNLANLYAEVGNYSLAKVHYEISIEVEPDFPNSYFNLGLTLAMNKEFPEAVTLLRKYRKLAPAEEFKQTDELIAQLESTF